MTRATAPPVIRSVRASFGRCPRAPAASNAGAARCRRGASGTATSLVARRDRVGRLVEAQEFRRLRFTRAAFEPGMLDELLAECADTVSAEGDVVLVRHCYVERRLRPLDLYARERPEAAALAAMFAAAGGTPTGVTARLRW